MLDVDSILPTVCKLTVGVVVPIPIQPLEYNAVRMFPFEEQPIPKLEQPDP